MDVPYSVQAFAVDRTQPYGFGAARALGVDPAVVFKTLLAKVDDRVWCAVLPVSLQLDLRALARIAGGKRSAMISAAEAQRITGYVVGGISPLGQRQALPTLIDDSARELSEIYVSAGARGLDVALSPMDLVRLTRAAFAPIASRDRRFD
jgi:Cys-tRNA(Pro)/Cys-tRNA(Cys) deacylase